MPTFSSVALDKFSEEEAPVRGCRLPLCRDHLFFFFYASSCQFLGAAPFSYAFFHGVSVHIPFPFANTCLFFNFRVVGCPVIVFDYFKKMYAFLNYLAYS